MAILTLLSQFHVEVIIPFINTGDWNVSIHGVFVFMEYLSIDGELWFQCFGGTHNCGWTGPLLSCMETVCDSLETNLPEFHQPG